MRRRGPLALAAAMLIAGSAAAQAPLAPGFRPLDLRATPIEQFFIGGPDQAVGELQFIGGLDLASDDSNFGAISGIDVRPDGGIVLASDTGLWFTFNLVEANGRPSGIDNPRYAPMLDGNGRAFGSKSRSDAEGLRLNELNGRLEALVTFEQSNQLRSFVIDDDFDMARAGEVPLPEIVQGLRGNSGLEAVAVAPADGPLAGAIVLVSERSLDKAGNHRAWILTGPRQGAFTIRRTDRFDVTDADFLPNGDLVILERRFGLGQGIAMRLRRFAAAELLPGKVVDGITVGFADLRSEIDNMEGLAVSTSADGETIVTLISDDNHNLLQRTLLLRFVWREVVPPRPVPRPASAGSGALLPDTGQGPGRPGRS